MSQQKEKLRRGGLEGIKSLYIGFGLIKGLSMNLEYLRNNRAHEQSNVHNLVYTDGECEVKNDTAVITSAHETITGVGVPRYLRRKGFSTLTILVYS
nr:hypothetical protein CFP56_51417 [Quercus suber]